MAGSGDGQHLWVIQDDGVVTTVSNVSSVPPGQAPGNSVASNTHMLRFDPHNVQCVDATGYEAPFPKVSRRRRRFHT